MEEKTNYLVHHGVKGMKWGVRRYQNYDGSLIGTRKEKKIARIEKRTQKRIDKSTKYDNKILEARSKNRGKIEAKYNKKINALNKDIDSFKPYASTGTKTKKGKQVLTPNDIQSSIKALESRRQKIETKINNRIKDFDDGTKYIKKGQQRYNTIIKNYGNAKVSAIKNSGYNKNPEYRSAVQSYTNQVISNMTYWSSGTKLIYAGEYARSDDKRRQMKS